MLPLASIAAMARLVLTTSSKPELVGLPVAPVLVPVPVEPQAVMTPEVLVLANAP